MKILLEGCNHFYTYEVGKSSTADRKGIDNTPFPKILHRAGLLGVNCLEPMRVRFGAFGPNSWYRGEPLEKEITWFGVKGNHGFLGWCNRHLHPVNENSWATYFARKSHPKGEAADCEIMGIPNDELYDWCKANLDYDQLIREFARPGDPYSGWCHISYKEEGNRHQAFSIP